MGLSVGAYHPYCGDVRDGIRDKSSLSRHCALALDCASLLDGPCDFVSFFGLSDLCPVVLDRPKSDPNPEKRFFFLSGSVAVVEARCGLS